MEVLVSARSHVDKSDGISAATTRIAYSTTRFPQNGVVEHT